MKNSGFVYIMTNKHRTTLYIGVTNDLCRRVYEHKNHLVKGSFTDRYNLEDCIYYEEFPDFNLAIQREKELKKWSRQKKEDLINKKNPGWKVLVSEQGFIRENKPFSEQVADLLKELQENTDTSPVGQNKDTLKDEEIPPVGRNDGGQAKGIPPVGWNHKKLGKEIPPFSRNDGATGGVKGEKVGGGTAHLFTSPLTKPWGHSERSEESPFPTDKQYSGGSEESFFPSDKQYSGGSEESPFPTDKQHSGGSEESPFPKSLGHAERSEKTHFSRNIGHSKHSEETLPRKRNL